MDFSAKGTKYFVLTGISVVRPFGWASHLDKLKYDCIEYGLENEYFHCSEDNSHVRRKVFNILVAHLNSIRIDSLIVKKSKTNPALREDKRFYPEMLGYLLKYVLGEPQQSEIGGICIITDSISRKSIRNAIKKAIKPMLAKMLPHGIGYRMLHHESRSHYGLQIVDYCCWAIFRKYERGDAKHYNKISPSLTEHYY